VVKNTCAKEEALKQKMKCLTKRRDGRNILQMLNDSELMKCNRLDHAAGVMFVVDLIRDALTFLIKQEQH